MSAPLPPHWNRYTTPEGKEYFHNTITNTTHWERPQPEPPATESGMADVFQYTPSALELEASGSQQRSVNESNLMQMQAPVTVPLGATPLGNSGSGFGTKALSSDNEMVSLMNTQASSPAAASAGASAGASATAAGSGTGFGGGLSSLVGGAIAAGAMAAAGGGGNNDGTPGLSTWLLSSAQQLFDVSTEDVVARLRLVLLPYPPPAVGAAEELKARPDFYGPFWVATTAVLFLAATGNFAQLVEAGTHAGFKADYGLVTIAASMIYGCLLAVPLVARLSLFASGEEVGSVDFRQMICVCGYSLAPSIPVSILCIVPLDGVRWLVTLLGLAASLLFLRGQLWSDFASRTNWLKWVLIITPCAAQVIVYSVYRMHFFSRSIS